MAYHFDDNPVDLTEDEDSRGTITDNTETSQLSYFSYTEATGNTPRLKTLSPCTPPPLTPICEINSLRDRRLLNNQNSSVPQLKRIRRSSSHSAQTHPPNPISKRSDNNINTDYSHHTYQDKFLAFQSQVYENPKPSIGKEWTIKKDGKTYKIVIPHNVMPSLNQSNGSVVVNVPEVGPIMLKMNPHFKDPTVSELKPFSLNFDEIIESASEPTSQHNSPQIVSSMVQETDLLYDQRFCWIQPKYKHYHHSFKSNFNGFSKTDMMKARRCVRNFTLCIKRLENNLEGKRQDSGRKNTKASNKGNSLIKVNHSNNVFEQMLENTSPSDLTEQFNFIHPHFQQCDSIDQHDLDETDVFSPNVVINTEDDPEFESIDQCINKSTRKNTNLKSTLNKQDHSLRMIKKQDIKMHPKTCFVKIFRNKTIENLIKLRKFSCPVNSSYNENLQTFASKFINTEVKFRKEIAHSKPLLVLNEINYSIVNFKLAYSKNNIVFSVDQKKAFPKALVTNNEFFSAVKNAYVKLVDCDVLIKYLKGEFGPPKSLK